MLAKAQDSTTTINQTNLFPDSIAKPNQIIAPKENKHPFAIAFAGGTQGGVFELKYGLNPKLALRAGVGILTVPDVVGLIVTKDIKSTTTTSANFTNMHLLLDYAPFKGKGLRLVGGAAYFNTAKASILMQPTDNFSYINIQLTAAETGTLTTNLNWQGIAPYAGIGLFKCFPKKVFNISLDLGTYYLTAPKGTFTGTGAFRDNSANDDKLTENAADYRFLPVMQLNFTFKF
jgi:hypothetical protein